MNENRFSEKRLVEILKEAEAGVKAIDLCGKYAIKRDDLLPVERQLQGNKHQRCPVIEVDASLDDARATRVFLERERLL